MQKLLIGNLNFQTGIVGNHLFMMCVRRTNSNMKSNMIHYVLYDSLFGTYLRLVIIQQLSLTNKYNETFSIHHSNGPNMNYSM